MGTRVRRTTPLLLGLVVALVGSGCDFIDDRLRTCGSLRVDVANSMQNLDPIHIASEDESFSENTLLPPGASRRLILCVERGDRHQFRAMQTDGNIVAVATCVVSKGRYEYESSVARIEWGPGGFRCQNW